VNGVELSTSELFDATSNPTGERRAGRRPPGPWSANRSCRRASTGTLGDRNGGAGVLEQPDLG